MEIVLAREMGFCWGVRRAVKMMEKAVTEKGEIVSLGPIVHNPQVVNELEEKGVHLAGRGQAIDGLPVAITAHGAPAELLEEVREQGLELIDTTCPIVTRSQRWARKMAEAGYTVLVFGDPAHREVKGVLGWCNGKGLALSDRDRIPPNLPSRLAVVSQTTQSSERFAAFVSELLQRQIQDISELRVINTLCDVTSNQQAATRDLAGEVDVVIVVGGKTSANTRHLLETCQEEGTPAFHVESDKEVQADWLIGRERVGVTGGASTPDSAIQAVVDRIQQIAQDLDFPVREKEALRP